MTAGPDTLGRVFSTPMANLYTNDIEAGLRFYRDLLGFTETFRTPRDGTPEHVELKLDGFMIGLGTGTARRCSARGRAARTGHGPGAGTATPRRPSWS